ncbi:hypothetical protein DMH25_08115 [Streptomyces sp. WAC 01325]|uniref:hypothetical protein n=1 Tax=Streptomyces sp. WAC 01325 TaxID=2203202 RepID=UPI000F890D7A|nr:hypothetical protein [Streptomyces sp. WAC 01325]RSN13746.1 hypothetical protein DMH25_08115 [Streptomyces sp. WAC 01325]
MQQDDEKTEAQVAAERRRALRASLERERDGYKTRGLDERVHQVEEQIKLLDSDDSNDSDDAAAVDEPAEQQAGPGPVETAVESKPRRTASRGKQGS